MKLWTKPKLKKEKKKVYVSVEARGTSGGQMDSTHPESWRMQAFPPQPLPGSPCLHQSTGYWNTFLYTAIHRPGPPPPLLIPLFKLTFQPLDVSAFWSFDTRHRAASVIFEPPFICKGFICKSFFLGVTKNKRFHLSFDPILLGLETAILY